MTSTNSNFGTYNITLSVSGTSNSLTFADSYNFLIVINSVNKGPPTFTGVTGLVLPT